MMKQLVPDDVCLACDVCCRFPEKTSFLAPIFSESEIRSAVAAGARAEWFRQNSDRKSSQIELAACGKTYVCACFGPSTHRCRIYDARPFDCRLYPFALMYDKGQSAVVLGMDTKCPFVREEKDARRFSHYAEYVAEFVESPSILETIAANWSLIQRYQEDVAVLRQLPKLSARVKCPPISIR